MHLLFVCSGNTCRSPMAEQIARKILAEQGLEWTVSSAGLYAVPGMPMSRHSAVALEQMGIQPTHHASTVLSESLLANANIVLTMTSGHAWDLRVNFPDHFDKIHELGVYATGVANSLSAACDIVDPYGGSLAHYTECAAMLKTYVEGAIARLREGQG